jgi:ribosomal protein S18 acetylase RimI-like enzyme
MNENISIVLRPVTAGDREFLLHVYEASRSIELGLVPWDAAQNRAFVEHQFDAQLTHYQNEYRDVSHDIIMFGKKPAGRLFISRGNGTHIAILDVTVLPEFRKRGIATRLIRDLQREAAGAKRSLRIFVEIFNPSQQFFRKLGFEEVSNDGMNLRFEWRA